MGPPKRLPPRSIRGGGSGGGSGASIIRRGRGSSLSLSLNHHHHHAGGRGGSGRILKRRGGGIYRRVDLRTAVIRRNSQRSTRDYTRKIVKIAKFRR